MFRYARLLPCLPFALLLGACTTSSLSTGSARAADAAMASRSEDSYERPEDVVRGLRLLEQALEARRDRRAAFVGTYWMTTRAIQRRIGTGYYEDDDYVSNAVVRIASYHRVAHEAYEDGRRSDVPVVWRRANDAGTRKAAGHEVVLLGIVAHVRDLAYVVADLDDRAARDRQRRDFQCIETILCETIDPVQRYLGRRHDRAFALMDALAIDYDESVFCRWLIAMRNEAWRFGVALADASDAEERRRIRARIETRFLQRSRFIGRTPLRALARDR